MAALDQRAEFFVVVTGLLDGEGWVGADRDLLAFAVQVVRKRQVLLPDGSTSSCSPPPSVSAYAFYRGLALSIVAGLRM